MKKQFFSTNFPKPLRFRKVLVAIIAIFWLTQLPPFGVIEGGCQNVGINQPNPDNSAILDITSTVRGLLIPRMTIGQREAIPSPATGLFIYNTSTNEINYYNGTGWYVIENNQVSTTTGSGTLSSVGVGINIANPDQSATLDVYSTLRVGC